MSARYSGLDTTKRHRPPTKSHLKRVTFQRVTFEEEKEIKICKLVSVIGDIDKNAWKSNTQMCISVFIQLAKRVFIETSTSSKDKLCKHTHWIQTYVRIRS